MRKLSLVLVLALWSCSSEDRDSLSDTGPVDTGATVVDAAAADEGVAPDAQFADATPEDADPRDADPRDDGLMTSDAGDPIDTGAPTDTGPVDLGSPGDAGETDGGLDCTSRDELTCEDLVGCRKAYCPGFCDQQNYVGCYGPNDPLPGCPPPQPCPCDFLNETDCEAAPMCHRVYVDPNNCPCQASGCCAQFLRCAANQLADCTGANLACRRQPPYCEAPYVVSYEGTCYEGCVLRGDCAP